MRLKTALFLTVAIASHRVFTKRATGTAVPGVKKFSINTKEYSKIFKMFARTIVAFFNVSSPYESYNTLNSQGEFAISEEGRSPSGPPSAERE
jgi:hypothetical protein